jgi:4-hydroxybenzoyl-CoA thioesterase/acyl-CoA thioester hydrolase
MTDLPFRTRRRVEFCDTDLSGIVHFSRYFVFMETAEHQLREALGFGVHSVASDRVLGWPRVAATCDYKSPARFGDWLDIEVRVERVGATSLTFRCILRTADRVVAEGTLSSVCCEVSPGGLKPVPIPEDLAKRIRQVPGTIDGQMPSPKDPPRIEVLDDEMAAVFAAKTGAERLAIAAGMFRAARRMVESHLRSEHPAWDSERLHSEVTRRLSHGAG